jgi:hypothetical protein
MATWAATTLINSKAKIEIDEQGTTNAFIYAGIIIGGFAILIATYKFSLMIHNFRMRHNMDGQPNIVEEVTGDIETATVPPIVINPSDPNNIELRVIEVGVR